MEPVTTMIGGWLGEWATLKVADTLLTDVSSKLNPSDLDKALKAATKEAQEQEKELFFRCEPDFVPRFLEQFFKGSGLEELQKPLKNEGTPQVDFLVVAFNAAAKEHSKMRGRIDESLVKPWIKVFVKTYFEQTSAYLSFQVAKEDYFIQLANYFDDVKFAGIAVEGQEIEKAEKLPEIFVMPDVVEDVHTRPGSELEQELLAEGTGDRQADLLREQRQRAQLEKRLGRKFSAAQLLSQSQLRKVVLLGAPGSGKTTSMSYFAVMLAQKKPEKLELPPDTDWLPILIRIRDLATQPDISILDFARQFAEKRMAVKVLPAGFFEYWLEDGRALILLDGLDEVAEEAKRYEVVRRIENFLGQFDQNRGIITSRPAGYKRDFFRTEEFPHYELQPFDDPKIEEFINHWYDSRVPDKEEARRRKDSLKKALSEQDRIKLLARNPLLLTIIALIHRYQALLPKERYKLYDKAVETLLTSWDANKELSNHAVLKYLELDDLRRLMESLAYWIHTQGNTGDKEGGTLIDRDELIVKLSRDIRTLKQIQLYEAKEEAKRFVDFIRDRTGLLNEQGQDCYAFVHKTFQEYLCAQEINYQRENEDDFGIVLNHIEVHLHNPHWREVLLLLIAQQKPKQAARAMRKILDQNSPYECWLHRDLLFAGNCLAENPKNLKVADNSLSQEILEALVKLEASDSSKAGYRIRNQVFQTLCALSESDFETKALQLLKDKASCINKGRLQQYRVALGEKEAVKDLLTLTKNKDSRSSAINILMNLDDTHEVVRTLLECLHDEDSEMRYWAVFAFLLDNKQRIDSEEVVQALLERLHDENFKVRSLVMSVLGNLKNPSEEVVRELLAQLQDEDSAMRSNAASALSKLGNTSEAVVRELLAGLQDEDSAVRSTAASGVGNLKNASEEVVKKLLRRLQDEDSAVRSRATSALSKLGNTSDQVVRELLARLQDEDSEVRSTACYALSRLANISEDVVRKLIAALQDEDSDVRSSAVIALGNLENPPEEVARELLARLQDKDSDVRSSAAIALGDLENPSEEVIKELLARLQDENSNVRSGACYALGKLENPSEEVVRELLGRLQDEDFGVRSSAVSALSRLGNASKEVIRELIARLEDKDSHLSYGTASIWGKLSKKSGNVIADVAQWIEQHQDSEYVGNGIDALGYLVAGEQS